MIAYHGTTKENAVNICKDGFSQEHQGINGNHFGDGVYLTTTKKRAKLYGNHIVSVEIDETNLFLLENWYPDYMNACDQAYKNGSPEKAVNTAVGTQYKERYMALGHSGIIMPVLMGTGKEMVVYDPRIIKSCW